jgi:hypothetical protein
MFSILELEKQIQNEGAFEATCSNREVSINLLGKSGDEPITANWVMGDVRVTDSQNFTLDLSKPIADTLKVFEVVSEKLLALMAINIKEELMHFRINGRKYENGETFVTMYTNQKLNIEVVTNSESIPFSKWEINGKPLEGADNPTNISITISPQVLPNIGRRDRDKNKLTMVGTDKKPIIELLVHTYHPPHLVFTAANHDGSFFWDDKGFTFENLKKPQYYDTIMVKERRLLGGFRDKEIYAPVLGLPQGTKQTLNVEVREFPDYALNDKDFRVVIRGTRNDFVQLNRNSFIELNAQEFQNLTSISVRAEKVLDVDNIHIEAIIPGMEKQVGLVEYYCRKIYERNVELIYVRFKDESSFPTLDPVNLERYLQNNSLNQLFLETRIVDTLHLYIDEEKTVWEAKVNMQLLQNLTTKKILKFGYWADTGNEIKNNYYFITDLDRGTNPGAHYPSKAGGFQARISSNDPPEEITAHEFGHWQGLPDTHNSRENIPVIAGEKHARLNFMNYTTPRRSWFKIQLINLLKAEDE